MQILLIGYGKMGQMIAQIAESRGHRVVAGLRSADAAKLPEMLKEADMAIEFTEPSAAYANIMSCFDAGVPVVTGTTGWTDKLPAVRKRCIEEGHSFFWASNFSIGMNLTFALNRKLAGWMNRFEQYVPQIEETHHTDKKDAPSGTAVTLAQEILERIDRKQTWKLDGEGENLLPVLAHRKPGVFGIHKVHYRSEYDTVTVMHEAHSRKGFASGAVLAAEWLKGKKGCFGMRDMLPID